MNYIHNQETPLWWAAHGTTGTDGCYVTQSSAHRPNMVDFGSEHDQSDLDTLEWATTEHIQSSSTLMSWMLVLHDARQHGSKPVHGWSQRAVALMTDKLVLFEPTGSVDVDPTGYKPSSDSRQSSSSTHAGASRPFLRVSTAVRLGPGSAVYQLATAGTDLEVFADGALITLRAASVQEAQLWILHVHSCIRRAQCGGDFDAPGAPVGHARLPRSPLLGDNDLLELADVYLEGQVGEEAREHTQPGPVSQARSLLVHDAGLNDLVVPVPSVTDGATTVSRLLAYSAVRHRLRAFARRLLPEHIPLLRAWEHIHACMLLLQEDGGVGLACTCGRPVGACRRLHRVTTRFFGPSSADRISLPHALAVRMRPATSSPASTTCLDTGTWRDVMEAVEALVRERLLLPYCRSQVKLVANRPQRKVNRSIRTLAESRGDSGRDLLQTRRGSFITRSAAGFRAASFAVLSAVTTAKTTKAAPDGLSEPVSGSKPSDTSTRRLLARLRRGTEGDDSVLGDGDGAWDEDGDHDFGGLAMVTAGLDLSAVPLGSVLCPHDPGLGVSAGLASDRGVHESESCLRAAMRTFGPATALLEHQWYAAAVARAHSVQSQLDAADPGRILLAQSLAHISLLFAHPSLLASLPVSPSTVQSMATTPLPLADLSHGTAVAMGLGLGLSVARRAGGHGKDSPSPSGISLLSSVGGTPSLEVPSSPDAPSVVLPAVAQAVEDALVESALLAKEWQGTPPDPETTVIAPSPPEVEGGLDARLLLMRSQHPAVPWWAGDAELHIAAAQEPPSPLLGNLPVFSLPGAEWGSTTSGTRAGSGQGQAHAASDVLSRSGTDTAVTNGALRPMAAPSLPSSASSAAATPGAASSRASRVRMALSGDANASSTAQGFPTVTLPGHWSQGVRYPVPLANRSTVLACWDAAPVDGSASPDKRAAVAPLLPAMAGQDGRITLTCIGTAPPGMSRTVDVTVDYPACLSMLAHSLGGSVGSGPLDAKPDDGVRRLPGSWRQCQLLRYADGAMELWTAPGAAPLSQEDSAWALLKGLWPLADASTAARPRGLLHLKDALDVAWTRDTRLPAHCIDVLTPGLGTLHIVPVPVASAAGLYEQLRDAATCSQVAAGAILGPSTHAMVIPPRITGKEKVRLQLRASLSGEQAAPCAHPSTPVLSAQASHGRVVLLSGRIHKRGLIRTTYQPRLLRLVLRLQQGHQAASGPQDAVVPSQAHAPPPAAGPASTDHQQAATQKASWEAVQAMLRIGNAARSGPAVPAFALRQSRAASAGSGTGKPGRGHGDECVEASLEYGRQSEGGAGMSRITAALGFKSRHASASANDGHGPDDPHALHFELRGTVPVWAPDRGGRILTISWSSTGAEEAQQPNNAGTVEWGVASPAKPQGRGSIGIAVTSPQSSQGGAAARLAARLGLGPSRAGAGRGDASEGRDTGRAGHDVAYELRVATPDRVWHFRTEDATAAGAWVAALTAFSAGRDAAVGALLPQSVVMWQA